MRKKAKKCRMKNKTKGARAKKRLRTLLVCVGLDEHQVCFPSRLIHCVWKAQYNTISQACVCLIHLFTLSEGSQADMDHRLILIKTERVYGHLQIEDVEMRCQKQIFILNHCNYTLRMRRINWTVWPLISARQTRTCSPQPAWCFPLIWMLHGTVRDTFQDNRNFGD